jgi:arsenite-transporting ATPase
VSVDATLLASLDYAREKPAVTLVVGKGGVGKSTLAASLANHFADERHDTLVVTTDPAATLLAALGRPIERTLRPRRIRDHLDAWAFDTEGLRDEFLVRWREPISLILDRGTYLDREDVDGLVNTALPGADEIFAMLTLGEVLEQPAYERVVIDTAPTGHTLRLLQLPWSFAALIRLLDAMQEKHRFMVRALTHRYRGDAADALLGELRERVDALQKLLTDPSRCRAVLVTRDEPVVQAETERFRAVLELAGIRIAATHMVKGSTGPRVVESDARQPVNLPIRSLTIVAGKGGVGKTTTACALALRSADSGSNTLLVSTDPAPSIADALAMDIGGDAKPVSRNLTAVQLDATRAFASFRDAYRDRIDALFAGLAGRGVDVALDREIIRDLFALAPPGIDELYALTVIGEELEKERFHAIVIDPAPTGHLLRLLDMPRLAIAWSHQLMRLMLKYRDVVSLGDAAKELLDFARRTRALEQRLVDPALTTTVIVALDEPLVREETARLARGLDERRLPVAAIIWNRATSAPPLPTDLAIPQLFAPLSEGLVGIDRIREWTLTWSGRAQGSAG